VLACWVRQSSEIVSAGVHHCLRSPGENGVQRGSPFGVSGGVKTEEISRFESALKLGVTWAARRGRTTTAAPSGAEEDVLLRAVKKTRAKKT